MEFTNALAEQTSPYLRQHAHNPVDWYPWCEAAFARARQEQKPVFLSIGYSTCHWCHVMAHESFEDLEVAALLNQDFISIKVDREERPDLDGVYMRACQAMTGSGGWPTSIFMSADGVPFYAGTYFPRENFLQLLEAISHAWRENRAALLESGAQLVAALSEEAGAARPDGRKTAPIAEAVRAFERRFDAKYGGFGAPPHFGGPKFPAPQNLLFLLRTAPRLAEKTLEQMYRGGIFDHIGGGFSRYSTDRYWLIPHFEKMLYDNALLACAYLLGYETTGKALYRDVVQRIFAYLERELRAPDGGFFSAQDADSEGGEGAYYRFTPAEVAEALGEADGARFCRRYGVTERGNFEGGSIPNLLGLENGEPPAAMDREADTLLPRLAAYRSRRPAPRTDKKQLTAWNALTAAAYAMAARILGDAAALDTARETVAFIERELTEGTAVFVGVTEGKRAGPGFLDDYAFFCFALLELHQATLEDRYLARAAALADRAWDLFWDPEAGGFFFSGADNETLVARLKESWDGAMPSGNSMMAFVLTRLELLTEAERFSDRAAKQRRFMNGEAAAGPTGYGFYLYSALPVQKIVCVPGAEGLDKNLRIRSDWAFRCTHDPAYPLVNGKTTYYVCRQNTCLPPTNTLPPDR